MENDEKVLKPWEQSAIAAKMIADLNKDVKWETLHSSKKQDWGTPDLLFKKLEKIYGPFKLDVAASYENTKCIAFYSANNSALENGWGSEINAKCFMNPPYGRSIGKWMKKAAEEARKGCTVVCLVPSRTGSTWFQNAMKEEEASEILFLKGRVVFETSPGQPVLDKKGKPMAAPFDSTVIVFRPKADYEYEGMQDLKIKWWDWKNE